MGSPSLLDVLRKYRHVGGPLGHHREWLKAANVPATRPHAHEHYTLCAALELLCCFDQLNCPALLGVELLGRRLQLIESAYEVSKDGKTPDFFHAEDLMGMHNRASGAVISSTLESETSERLKARAEITKQLTKAKASFRDPKKGAGKGAKEE